MKVNCTRKTELEITAYEKEIIVGFLDIVFEFYERQRSWKAINFTDMLDDMRLQDFNEDFNYGDENEEFNVKIIDK